MTYYEITGISNTDKSYVKKNNALIFIWWIYLNKVNICIDRSTCSSRNLFEIGEPLVDVDILNMYSKIQLNDKMLWQKCNKIKLGIQISNSILTILIHSSIDETWIFNANNVNSTFLNSLFRLTISKISKLQIALGEGNRQQPVDLHKCPVMQSVFSCHLSAIYRYHHSGFKQCCCNSVKTWSGCNAVNELLLYITVLCYRFLVIGDDFNIM